MIGPPPSKASSMAFAISAGGPGTMVSGGDICVRFRSSGAHQ